MIKTLTSILILVLIFTSCKKNKLEEVESLTKKSLPPTEVANGVELIYSDSARVKAKLNAPKMVRYLTDNPSIEMPDGLLIKFYDTSLNETSMLRANYGIRYLNTEITEVRGDVQVVNVQGDTLNTEELYWNQAEEKVYSPKFVKVKRKDEIILADGFESDINFTKYTFKNITGIISLKE